MENLNELQEQIKGKMQGIAKNIESQLPQGFGFVVLTFPFGENKGNLLMYASNANREDVCHAMTEFIQKTENNYGKDVK